MRLTNTLLTGLAIAATSVGVAEANTYSAYAWYDSVTVAPRRITINAYQAEDTVTMAPSKAYAHFSFNQDAELYQGSVVAVRFGMVFDPDNIMLAAFSTSIPTQNVPIQLSQNVFVDQTVAAPINLPATLSKFKSWCTAPGTSYRIEGIIWTQLPNVLSSHTGQPLHSSQPLEVLVNCMEKKLALKVDLSRLPTKVLLPKLNIKIQPRPLPPPIKR